MATRFYIITSGFYDMRNHALVSGKPRPTITAMRKRFEAAFGSSEDVVSEVRATERAHAAGYEGEFYADVFVDWLIKQGEGFERVDFREVSL